MRKWESFSLKMLLDSGLPLYGVFGNNDGERRGLSELSTEVFEGPHRFELGGRMILLAHEPGALARAVKLDDDVAVYGHTHEPKISAGDPLTINPGETCGWLSGRSTGAILDLEGMSAEIVEFGRQERPTI